MQITISRRAALIIAIGVVLIVPATAVAQSLFTDVADNSVHFPGIEFMKDSGVTLGCGDGTTFCPDDPVLREQMATFMYRLSGNDPNTAPSVIPISNLQTASSVSGFEVTTETWTDLANGSTTHVVPAGREGFIVATFSGESVCTDTVGSCYLRILVDGTEMGPADGNDFFFDSPESATSLADTPWESHAVQRFSGTLAPGSHTVKVQMKVDVSTADSTFWVDDWLLTTEVHYTG